MTEFRTTVETSDGDQDEHPGMAAAVEEDGSLTIVDKEGIIEADYAPDEWTSMTVEKVEVSS